MAAIGNPAHKRETLGDKVCMQRGLAATAVGPLRVAVTAVAVLRLSWGGALTQVLSLLSPGACQGCGACDTHHGCWLHVHCRWGPASAPCAQVIGPLVKDASDDTHARELAA